MARLALQISTLSQIRADKPPGDFHCGLRTHAQHFSETALHRIAEFLQKARLW
jgi:hypothetical protein